MTKSSAAGQKAGRGRTVSRVIAVCLAIAVLTLMPTADVEDIVHEWAGISLVVLAVVHIILTRRRWSAKRPIRIIVDVAIIACAIGLAVTSVYISRYVFAWLPALKGTGIARRVHMTCGFWFFVLVSIHVGMHLHALFGKLMRNKAAVWCGRIVFAICVVVGLWSWVDMGIGGYLLLQSGFAFVNGSQPLAVNFFRYLAMAIMLAGAAHYVGRLFAKLRY